jgi:tRNA threonylcarbamoyladenosine biosynthesis protein TsaB
MSGRAAGAGPVLAFDTSGGFGSVAVEVDGRVRAERVLPEARRHGALLAPAIFEALEEARVRPRDLSSLIVGSGPGSFTGVRIAAATARGLGHALGIPVYPRSSLAAAAALLPELPPELRSWPRFVLFDARADRLYGGCWEVGADAMVEVVSERALTVDELLTLPLPPQLLLMGDGARAHAESLERETRRVVPFPGGIPSALGLLAVHRLLPSIPAETVESRWEPNYLRSSQPEREAAGG